MTDAFIGGTDRREIIVNRMYGHLETLSQLYHISISKLFDLFIYKSIRGRTHCYKVADKREGETHHHDRTKECMGGSDASTGQTGTYKHNPGYQYCNHLVEAEVSRRQKGRDTSSG